MNNLHSSELTSEGGEHKILFIDDEKNVLAAIHRQLRRQYNILPALSGAEGLAAVAKHKPAVVVCDMRMPDMDGITTLSEIEKKSPNTVRIMLTGNADQETAVDAINRGRIFRFLNKPCSDQVLRAALDDALRQHELITSEKTLLQKTLIGSVRAMADILSLVVPAAFEKSVRVRNWARLIADEINMPSRWELDLAAMLYPIGLVMVPSSILDKVLTDSRSLSPQERQVLLSAPESARRLLSHIPRLKNVANIIAYQDRGYDGSGTPDKGPIGEDILLGSRILKVLKDLADITNDDVPSEAAVTILLKRAEIYDPAVLIAASNLWSLGPHQLASGVKKSKRFSVQLDTLLPNDLLVEPIMLKSGKLLLSEGIRVSAAQIERLRNIRSLEPIQEPVIVERINDV